MAARGDELHFRFRGKSHPKTSLPITFFRVLASCLHATSFTIFSSESQQSSSPCSILKIVTTAPFLENVIVGLWPRWLPSTVGWDTGPVSLHCWVEGEGTPGEPYVWAPTFGGGAGSFSVPMNFTSWIQFLVFLEHRLCQEFCHIHLTKWHINTLQRCQGHKREENMEKLLEAAGDSREIISKCNVGCWAGSRNNERTWGENRWNSKNVFSSSDRIALLSTFWVFIIAQWLCKMLALRRSWVRDIWTLLILQIFCQTRCNLKNF